MLSTHFIEHEKFCKMLRVQKGFLPFTQENTTYDTLEFLDVSSLPLSLESEVFVKKKRGTLGFISSGKTVIAFIVSFTFQN